MKMLPIAFIILFICSLLLILTCEKSTNQHMQVEFVVPDNYLGYFWVITDAQHGVEVEPLETTYVLNVPDSGILRVKDASFLSEWHRQSARYQSGEALRVGGDPDDKSADPIGLWILSTSSDKITTFLVGDTTARDEYYATNGGIQARHEFTKRREKLNSSGE